MKEKSFFDKYMVSLAVIICFFVVSAGLVFGTHKLLEYAALQKVVKEKERTEKIICRNSLLLLKQHVFFSENSKKAIKAAKEKEEQEKKKDKEKDKEKKDEDKKKEDNKEKDKDNE
ncbi:MAG: hypothetical protein GX578_05275 [Clostridiales bacterium]|nr:hypothetical protein [Clostridiales bacterium]